VTLVLDTSAVLALYNAGDDDHARVVAWLDEVDEDLVTTPLVVAELDHLVRHRGGPEAQALLWDDLDRGAFVVRWWSTAMSETLAIARARPELRLPDASILALAPVARTERIATLDPVPFRDARTADGTPFTLLPDDA
jgi:predicted nucleic acid-binding protein